MATDEALARAAMGFPLAGGAVLALKYFVQFIKSKNLEDEWFEFLKEQGFE